MVENADANMHAPTPNKKAGKRGILKTKNSKHGTIANAETEIIIVTRTVKLT